MGKYCSNCGNLLRDDQQVCNVCGTRRADYQNGDFGNGQQSGYNGTPYDSGQQPYYNGNFESEAKKKKKAPIVIGIITACVAVLALIICFLVFYKKTPETIAVDLSEAYATADGETVVKYMHPLLQSAMQEKFAVDSKSLLAEYITEDLKEENMEEDFFENLQGEPSTWKCDTEIIGNKEATASDIEYLQNDLDDIREDLDSYTQTSSTVIEEAKYIIVNITISDRYGNHTDETEVTTTLVKIDGEWYASDYWN